MNNLYVIEIINRMIDNTRRGRLYTYILPIDEKTYYIDKERNLYDNI